MKSTSNKAWNCHMRTFLVFTLMSMSAAWLGSVVAAPKPEHWEGGNPGTHDPFWICLNVSADGKRLTAQNTQCRGNRGDDWNSIHIEFHGGRTSQGERCHAYSYRNINFGDIQIKDDGTFTATVINQWINKAISGTFNDTEQKVTGRTRSINKGIDGGVDWEAMPAATPKE